MTPDEIIAVKASLIADANAAGLMIVVLTGTYDFGKTHTAVNSTNDTPEVFVPIGVDKLRTAGDIHLTYFGPLPANLLSIEPTYAAYPPPPVPASLPDTSGTITGANSVISDTATAYRPAIATVPRPCPIHMVCPAGLDGEEALMNLSSEAPDPLDFISNDPGPYDPPPLGKKWLKDGCIVPCVSYISQEEADLCAAAQAVLCNNNPNDPHDPPGGPDDPNDPNDPGGDPDDPNNPNGPGGGGPVVFANTQQQAGVYCPNGSLFVITVPAGIILNRSQAVANALAVSYGQEQAYLIRVCLCDIPDKLCIGDDYSAPIRVTTAGSYIYTMTGMLPPGLTMAPSEGALVLSGTVTTAGVYAFEVKATNPKGQFVIMLYQIYIMAMTSASVLPNADVGVPYEFEFTATGGVEPFTFDLESGSLPPGLELSEEGVLSGTPTAEATYALPIRVTDADESSCLFDCQITVGGLLTCTLVDPTWTDGIISGGGSVEISHSGKEFAISASLSEHDAGSLTADATAEFTYSGPAAVLDVDLTVETLAGESGITVHLSTTIEGVTTMLMLYAHGGGGTGTFHLPMGLMIESVTPVQYTVIARAGIPLGPGSTGGSVVLSGVLSCSKCNVTVLGWDNDPPELEEGTPDFNFAGHEFTFDGATGDKVTVIGHLTHTGPTALLVLDLDVTDITGDSGCASLSVQIKTGGTVVGDFYLTSDYGGLFDGGVPVYFVDGGIGRAVHPLWEIPSSGSTPIELIITVDGGQDVCPGSLNLHGIIFCQEKTLLYAGTDFP